MRFYSVNEIAKIFNVTRLTVLNWINRGMLKAGKFGGVWRISEEDLKAFIQNGYKTQNQTQTIVKQILNQIK